MKERKDLMEDIKKDQILKDDTVYAHMVCTALPDPCKLRTCVQFLEDSGRSLEMDLSSLITLVTIVVSMLKITRGLKFF